MNSVVFLVVIPLIAAFLSLFFGKNNKILSYLVTVFNLAFSIMVLFSNSIPFNVAIGGWRAPYGINFVVTDLTIFFLLLVNLAALLALTTIRSDREYQFYSFYFVLLAATNGMVLTGDMFNFFLFVELSTFAVAGLVAYKKNRLSTGAALKYLILSSTASMFSLAAIGLIYKTLGTLNFADIANKVKDLNPASSSLILILFVSSMLVELKIFPFNMWVVKAYEASTTAVNLFIHGMLGTAGVYAALRIILMIFANDGLKFNADVNISMILTVFAFVTVIISEIGALNEKNLKKILAFSSMAQLGVVLFGISLGSFDAIKGVFYVVLSNYLAKFVMFMVAKEFSKVSGSLNYDEMKGLGRKYPMLAISFTIAALSLMGIPYFAGFWGKLSIIGNAILFGKAGVIGSILILIASVIEGVYYLRISHTFFVEGEEKEIKISRVNCLIPMIIAIVIIIIGIYPNSVENIIVSLINEIQNVQENYIRLILSIK
ncbi:Na(+)/H(+) antiporter subunit D1 [Caloramator mitchellensis]|uniref:Na(+)/H(+) antiporter subunit D1 n=1 Tax=Caloramator mitchellensis TaxID=908809 RepID=A0A0R3K3D4_CALMK|nr:proton-conducting transporter membrane subunit [Caloramator mitchellensis]KRQ87924.1 Na(+)/H(+) antiporter subunit D1 [Caloramator mitchellensis]